ncbi:MAG: helix-turn-helix domain-containing protein [Planctomycetota bacterium]|nr:helix-turn-helix domain-containing protein [Planctomycetota bacterium]
MTDKAEKPRRGSSFDSFLQEEGIYEEVNAGAVKKVLAWQLAQALEKGKITKTELAARMLTSRAAVNRLLDPDNPSLNLRTMEKAARALGRKLAIQLVEA